MDRTCPNCRNAVEGDRRLCPHCGAALAPPVPWLTGSARTDDVAAPERLLTGSRGGDRTLGILAGLLLPALLFLLAVPLGNLSTDRLPPLQLLWMPWFASIIVVPIVVWARLRPRCPVFAKAFGWTLLAILIAGGVLVLGAFVLCTSMLVMEGAHH